MDSPPSATSLLAVVFSPTARNLIELFFQRERARKPATWVAANTTPAPVAEGGGGRGRDDGRGDRAARRAQRHSQSS